MDEISKMVQFKILRPCHWGWVCKEGFQGRGPVWPLRGPGDGHQVQRRIFLLFSLQFFGSTLILPQNRREHGAGCGCPTFVIAQPRREVGPWPWALLPLGVGRQVHHLLKASPWRSSHLGQAPWGTPQREGKSLVSQGCRWGR